jgi:hypothetical protein
MRGMMAGTEVSDNPPCLVALLCDLAALGISPQPATGMLPSVAHACWKKQVTRDESTRVSTFHSTWPGEGGGRRWDAVGLVIGLVPLCSRSYKI